MGYIFCLSVLCYNDFVGHESPLGKEVIIIKKKYVRSVQEVRVLERKGYTLWAMAYFVNDDGPALYIMAK